jgi:signal transduction histidine kinase
VAFIVFSGAGRLECVSAVGLERMWEPGLDGDPVCAAAIDRASPLFIIPDLTEVPAFAGSPLVAGTGLRFYAGALVAGQDGQGAGVLCVMDSRPRELSDLQHDALLVMAGQVTIQRDLRRALAGAMAGLAERTRTEQALRDAGAAAEQAMVSRSRFLATAAHDLRQPVQSLLLFLGVLKPHVLAEGKEALNHIVRGLDGLRDLLDSLLDISRLDAGIVQPSVEDIPLHDLMDPIIASYAPLAAGKGLQFQADLCARVLRSDPTLLGRMVRNLIENALRYTEAGRIGIRCREVEGRLRIEVYDTGIGIAPEHLTSIWEEFHQIAPHRRDRDRGPGPGPGPGPCLGLGLGLAMVQRLSALLDHPVDVRSTPGRGSVFTIAVPMGEAVPDGVPQPTVQEIGAGRYALVVDDDAVVLLGLKATFEAWGYDVLAVRAAGPALEGLRQTGRQPDVIVADYRLREGQCGTDVILQVRAQCDAAIPGIILTGETGAEAQRDAKAHGFDLILKPVTPRQLHQAVERLLASV